jgi:hypothetical protein
MADEAKLKLGMRLSPANGVPDPVILDDIIRLVRQGILTAPKQAPQIADPLEFRPPDEGEEEVRALESRIRSRIQKASVESQAAVEKRTALAATPGSEQQLADEARRAAEYVVAAVQGAILRGVKVQVPTAPGAGPSAVS